MRTPFVIALMLLGCASARPATAQTVPRFEAGPCAIRPGDWAQNVRLECGALVVAMDRQHPELKQLRLAVAILHPGQRPSEPPLVLLHGGPAGPGGLRADPMALAVRWSSALNRDIVVYDQRGAGFSEPELCPEAAAQALQQRTEASARERERGWNEAADRCVADLKRDDLDPHFFNSRVNAEDLIDLRRTLGYESWDVFGVSYGARLAQEVMKRDGRAVHSAILASPLIPGVAKAEDALSVQRAIDRVFEECAAQTACRSAFPAPEQDLVELYRELNATPMEVVVERGNARIPVVLDGRRFVSDLVGRFSVRQLNRLPLLLHEFRRGDRTAAARLLVADGLGPNVANNALTNLVTCYDIAGTPAYRMALDNVNKTLKEPFRQLVVPTEMCSHFLQRYADAAEHEFVRSDIPTLILTNQFDDRTPTDHGRRIAASLSHVYQFELPALGHAETPAGCFDAIVHSFLKNPDRQPDGGCVAAMPRLTFEARRLERPMLFFAIGSTDSALTPFAGTWDAAFPNAPRPFTFSLTIANGRVSGSVTAGGGALNLPVVEGAADQRTLMFKVNSPDGGRVITFTGSVDGDTISFQRDVLLPPGADPGGNALWGTTGPRTFTAQRAR
ncbi:MAG TPA: alpha/beta hydrolase [Vicinamibacterales bacterium]|nr:alpha/beta hydrolase [Vicinamibacterales bacterium]